MQDHSPIIFFDGVCGLCNRFVDFLIARDRRGRLRFAPIQGRSAQQLLPENLREKDFDTVVFRDERGISVRSEAAIRSLQRLGGIWRCSGILFLIPARLRDSVYDGVAKNRYRWFGKRETCRLPSASERQWFLD